MLSWGISRNKFESISKLIIDTFDIFQLRKNKLGLNLPHIQFSIADYRIIRKYKQMVVEFDFTAIKIYILNWLKAIRSDVLTLEIVLDKINILLIVLYKPSFLSRNYFLFGLIFLFLLTFSAPSTKI